jgi:hypothetical protein
MRPAPARAAGLLLLMAAACVPPGGPGPRDWEPFRPCPGQEAAMAALQGRAKRAPRHPHRVVGVSVATVDVRDPAQLDSVARARRGRPGPQRTVRVEMELRVDSAGRVADARLLHGTGDADLDTYLLRDAMTQTFDPAREAAFPVPGCAIQTLPVELDA